MGVDLVCWDFGDTLVDERFMRIAPIGVPDWGRVLDEVLAERVDWVDRWNLGCGSLNDLIVPLAERLPMTPVQVASHLRSVWNEIDWFDEAAAWVDELTNRVAQAVVTVNPHEFSGIARACGLDARIPVIVTSAELGTRSKVRMAERVRELLALPPGVDTTLLIDNNSENVDEFIEAGGRAIHYRSNDRCLDAIDNELAKRPSG